MARTHRFGRRGELLALLLLLIKGYRLRHRNWRGGGGEIDLVMKKKDVTVFVEVKARSAADFGGAVAALDRRKQQKLARAASAYLSRFDLWDSPTRFDLMTLQPGGRLLRWRLTHIQDAFQCDFGRRL